MLARRHKKSLALLLMAVLLCAQAIGIAQACASPNANAAMAFSPEVADSGCHMAGMRGKATSNPNGCLQHCTGGDQSSAHAQVAVPAVSAIPVLSVPAAPPHRVFLSRFEARLAAGSDPPCSLRFCSFQL
ncbi:MAG TPA: hypothetical protein VFV71_10945 [Burkholderiales bacterium]|nr:hypothetical protein [Burkholderiales bacterium]